VIRTVHLQTLSTDFTDENSRANPKGVLSSGLLGGWLKVRKVKMSAGRSTANEVKLRLAVTRGGPQPRSGHEFAFEIIARKPAMANARWCTNRKNIIPHEKILLLCEAL
jgi:hypothetical protein